MPWILPVLRLRLLCAAVAYHLPGWCEYFSCHLRDGHVVHPLGQYSSEGWAHVPSVLPQQWQLLFDVSAWPSELLS